MQNVTEKKPSTATKSCCAPECWEGESAASKDKVREQVKEQYGKAVKADSLAARSTRRFLVSIGPPTCAAPSTWTSSDAPGAQAA